MRRTAAIPGGLFRRTRRELLHAGLRGWAPTKGGAPKRWQHWERREDVPEHLRQAVRLAVQALPQGGMSERLEQAVIHLAQEWVAELGFKVRVAAAAEVVRQVEPEIPFLAIFHACGLELGMALTTSRNQYYRAVALKTKEAGHGHQDRTA